MKDPKILSYDIEKALEPMFTTAPEDERAGLGFAVMESFMDKLGESAESHPLDAPASTAEHGGKQK